MANNNEIWRDIPNYEGYYQVSNRGRVKSLERTITDKNGKMRRINEHVFKLSRNSKGVYRVRLCKNNTQSWVCVFFMANNSIMIGTLHQVFKKQRINEKEIYKEIQGLF